jgi:hypothetical protein
MSVKPGDIRFYGSANMPDGDGATTGGALDTTKKITFVDVSPTGTVDYVSSSSSDTATTITATGRDSTGAIQPETKTLNGTTKVTGSQSFERLLKAVAGGTTAVGVIAVLSHTALISAHTAQAAANSTGITPALIQLQSGDAASCAIGDIIRITNNTPSGVQYLLKEIIAVTGYGTDYVAVDSDWSTVPSSSTTYDVNQGMLFNLAPNQVTQVRRPFYNASADIAGGVNKDYFEKIFAVNNNTTIALTAVQISKQVDPSSGVLDLALTSALNDTGTVAARQTGPTTGLNGLAANTLGAAITTTTATSLTMTANAAFPQTIVNGGFFIQIDSEILFVTAGAGTNSWTVARGQCGSTAATHTNGTAVTQYISNGAAPQTINVPSPQNLPSGAAPNAAGAQGVWLHLHLTPGLAPAKTSFTLREYGTTV